MHKAHVCVWTQQGLMNIQIIRSDNIRPAILRLMYLLAPSQRFLQLPLIYLMFYENKVCEIIKLIRQLFSQIHMQVGQASN